MNLDSGRVLRAIVTVITLLACLWVLTRLRARPNDASVAPAQPTSSRSVVVKPSAYTPPPAMPPVEVLSLPLFASDNTCDQSDTMDMSSCTHALSGSAARIYQIQVQAGQSLFVSVVPQSDYFDAGIAVLSDSRKCIGGADERGEGQAETLALHDLAPGRYQVAVTGYHDDCGPYQLTVRTDLPPIAQLSRSWCARRPNGNVISWQTFAEVDLSHFVVYRVEGNSRLKIGSVRGHGTPAGWSTYRLVNRQPTDDTHYLIEAISFDGRTESVTT